ncbi:hypothetical protein EJB05_27236, partial [Eragrostis curvula]
MQVVTGAMSTLLPKLANLLTEEYKLQKNIRGEIMFLKTELESMEAALLKISEAPIDEPPDNQVKIWAREVRELSYDIEDSVDTFMVRIDTHAPTRTNPYSFRGFFEKTTNLLTRAKIRHKIGIDIRGIKNHIKEVSERRDRYKVQNVATRPIGQTVDNLRLAALYKKTTELVGTKESTRELVQLLMVRPKKKKLRIVSIVGFGGLGKTTLAKLAYDKLKGDFKCGAFVSLSLTPNMINVFTNMLHQLGHKSEATWSEAQFIDELRKVLSGKRYLIVIDDIWSIFVWDTIKYALIENKLESKIIMTTRKLDVAKQANVVYPLKPLSLSDSRKLFYLRVFGCEHECPPNELARVSDNILTKCGGVPLAIITIASLLASKKGKEHSHACWSKVYLSMGSGLEDSSDIKDMRRILSLSYYDLPPHLKACLLYLGSYPEDSEINTEVLIWKLVGEGFVCKEEGKSIYEEGEHYIKELVNRSLIQPETIGPEEMVATFRIHDMVLDLITHLSSDDHFLTVLDGQSSNSLPNKIRRLSLQTSDEDDVKQLSTMSLTHVRSLTVSASSFHLVPSLSRFPMLLTLDLNGCKKVVDQHFRDICNLFHLRYLGLRSTGISKIPIEIRNLQFLLALDIGWTDIEELPSTFSQLQRLMYLCADYPVSISSGFGNLKYLEALIAIIVVESPTMLQHLEGMKELRSAKFQFYNWDEVGKKHFLQWLSNMPCLKYIEIYGCHGDLDSPFDRLSPTPQELQNIHMVGGVICAVPRWMSSLSTLSSVTIVLHTIGDEDLRLLGSMPSLASLSIKVEEETQERGNKLAIRDVYPFRCLKKLCIRHIMEVTFAPGAMQNLVAIHLAFELRQIIDQFGDSNFGLENLSSLVDISVEMICSNANINEVKIAEATFKKAVNRNSNRPTMNLVKYNVQLQPL